MEKITGAVLNKIKELRATKADTMTKTESSMLENLTHSNRRPTTSAS
jgi:hypothetical protein